MIWTICKRGRNTKSKAEDVVVAAAVVEAWEKWDDEHDGSDAVAWADILRLLVSV